MSEPTPGIPNIGLSEGLTDDESTTRELILREHFALRQEILQRLNGTADIEKVALLATASIYAFLIGFDRSKVPFVLVELMLWWAPFFALTFSWSKIGHHAKRIQQMSDYLYKIERQIYGPKGHAAQGCIVSGWETELRHGPQAQKDWVMQSVEKWFWRMMIALSFGIALLNTLVAIKIVDVSLATLPQFGQALWSVFELLAQHLRIPI